MPVSEDKFWKLIFDLFNLKSDKLIVPKSYFDQTDKIKSLLNDDYTGVVSTVLNYMIQAGTVKYKFETENTTLNKLLNETWQENVNSQVNIDVVPGLRKITADYLRERWSSSFIALNMKFETVDGFQIPTKMWLSDGSQITVDPSPKFGQTKYFLGRNKKDRSFPLPGTEVLIRKPFESQYVGIPTPYLVKKGVLRYALLKKIIVDKQTKGMQEVLPYLLMLSAGNDFLAQKDQLPTSEDMEELKQSLITAENDYTDAFKKGKSVFKGRYDVNVEHLIPDFTKFFDEKITKSTDKNILFGLGLVELEGFGDTRQEAILNPKMLVEEVVDAVLDLAELYKAVLMLILEKNKLGRRNLSQKNIKVLPGVIRGILSQSMLKMIESYSAKGILSIEDTFEGLPHGFNFETTKIRRMREKDNGDEELFFPRVILNQDNEQKMNEDLEDTRVLTPEETPKARKHLKKKKNKTNYSELPEEVKDILPEMAQEMWYRAFSFAVEQGKTKEASISIAWEVIRKTYEQNENGKWMKKLNAQLETIDDLPEDINKEFKLGDRIKFIKAVIL